MEENHHQLRPLLNPSASTSTSTATAAPPFDDQVLNNLKLISSNSSIIFRLSLIILIGLVSIWANHEASKGYAITIVNESGNTFSGTRFNVFYVSNDEATRIMIKASKFIEDFLYPDDIPTKKLIDRVIIKLARYNMTENVTVESSTNREFVINISPSVMEDANFGHNMVLAVKQGVARIWLWDGQGQTPKNLINGIVEYLVNYVGGSSAVPTPEKAELRESSTVCWKRRDPRLVADFLNHCERHRPGFIRRLNLAMKDGWDDEKLGSALGRSVQSSALGRSVQNLCTTYESLRYNSFSV